MSRRPIGEAAMSDAERARRAGAEVAAHPRCTEGPVTAQGVFSFCGSTAPEYLPDDPKRNHRPHCLDCGVDVIKIGHWYMVADAIWAATGLGRNDGALCLACLRHRLGRPLSLEDFRDDTPVNREDSSAALREKWRREDNDSALREKFRKGERGPALSGQFRKTILRAIGATPGVAS